jgi:hypothetical protein
MSRKKEIKAQIKELKKELNSIKYNGLKVGEWYKYVDCFLFCFNGKFGNSTNYGFNKIGVFKQDLGVHRLNRYTKATETEVFEALKKEAIKRGFKEAIKRGFKEGVKRGFKEGVTLRSLLGDKQVVKINTFVWVEGVLFLNNIQIFQDGKWAEIIEYKKPTINGYEMKINGDYISFGCEKFSTDQILGLYSHFNQHNITSFAIDNEYQVTISELEEVVNYINSKI